MFWRDSTAPGKEAAKTQLELAELSKSLSQLLGRITETRWSFLKTASRPETAADGEEETAADGEKAAVALGYDAHAEYTRQGAVAPGSGWRATKLNERYGLCATYPTVLHCPSLTTDEELEEVAKFRSKQRLPVLSWFDHSSHAAIVRCAQPLIGIGGNKSAARHEHLLWTPRVARC